MDDSDKIILFQSWSGKSKHQRELKEVLTAEKIFEDLEVRNLEEGRVRDGRLEIDNYLKPKTKILEKEIASSKETKKLEKKLIRMKGDMKKFEVIKYLEKQTTTNLEEVKKIGQGRFSVSFRGLNGHFKKREFLFDKIKQWKISRANLQKRISMLEEIISGAEKPKPKNRAASLVKQKVISPIWGNKKESKTTFTKSKFVTFQLNNFKCFVGRRATESDTIRKTVAKKDDLWL